MKNSLKDIDRLVRNVWTEKISTDYVNGLINSERALQACLYHHLRASLEKSRTYGDLELFVEQKLDGPRGQLGKLRGKTPDLIICRGKEIVAFFELKFVPEGRPVFEGDFKKFDQYHERKGNKVFLHIDPDTGYWVEEKTYSIASEPLIYYAAIARSDSGAFKPKSMRERFQELDFVTVLAIKIDADEERKLVFSVAGLLG